MISGMPRMAGLPHGQPPMKPVVPMMPPPPPLTMKHPFHNQGPRPGLPPGQVISVEELEGRAPTAPSPTGGDVPRPDVQAKILNLTRQKSDFEQKQNANANMRERMMLLQHQKPAPPMVYPQQLPRGQGPAPFDMSGPPPMANRHGLNGHPTGPPPPLPPAPINEAQQAGQPSKERIFEYLVNEKRHRILTPTEEKFLDKFQQQQREEHRAQMALREEITKKMMDPRLQDHIRGPPMNGMDHRQQSHQQHQAHLNKSISLERQKAQFDEYGRGPKMSGSDGKVSALAAFTPTSVMRKMVRNRDDGPERTGSAQNRPKITPLEHTGVLRVPKNQDPRKPKPQQQQQQQQQVQNRNIILQNFPPLNPPPMNPQVHFIAQLLDYIL